VLASRPSDVRTVAAARGAPPTWAEAVSRQAAAYSAAPAVRVAPLQRGNNHGDAPPLPADRPRQQDPVSRPPKAAAAAPIPGCGTVSDGREAQVGARIPVRARRGIGGTQRSEKRERAPTIGRRRCLPTPGRQEDRRRKTQGTWLRIADAWGRVCGCRVAVDSALDTLDRLHFRFHGYALNDHRGARTWSFGYRVRDQTAAERSAIVEFSDSHRRRVS
jgi:hypothetical protein